MGASPQPWGTKSLAAAIAAWVVLRLCACGLPVRVAQTASDPSWTDASVSFDDVLTQTSDSVQAEPDATPPPPPPNTTSDCPDTLNDRLELTSFTASRDVRYKLLGYEGFPFDERVAFAPVRNGTAYVAWTDDATGRVLVTPLNEQWERAGNDIETNSHEVGGLVGHDDGFALLTLRADPSGSGGDPNLYGTVTLLRYQRGSETFAVPLTGLNSITQRYGSAVRDVAPGYLYGRLAWNGAKYGAYFIVQSAPEDPQGPQLTDKLVYIDDSGGALRGGFSGKCVSNQGLRLWPEPDVYIPICLADALPAPGLNLVAEDQAPLLLAPEAHEPGWSGGQMGSIVKLSDNTYFVGWLSRDIDPAAATSQPGRVANDIAMVRLGADRQPIRDKRWLVETEGVAETNLHFARYGQSQILMVWDSIRDVHCDKMCFGTYAGTHASVLDHEGNVVKAGTIRAVPNHHDDLVTLPNGDVAWAYVPDSARDYSTVPPARDNLVLAPAKRRVQIARLRYCE